MRQARAFIPALLIIVIAHGIGYGQTSKMVWCSFNSGGGGASDGTHAITCSAGQSTAGFVQNTGDLHWVGFWVGDVFVPDLVAKIADAKCLPNGWLVSIAGKTATTSGTDFNDFFYIEEPDRSSGILVAVWTATLGELVRGSVVDVVGAISTTSAGEREIVNPRVIIGSTTTPLKPLSMPNWALAGGDIGGSGLSNVGLLVQTWGYVIQADDQTMLITDGSAGNLMVDPRSLAAVPDPSGFATVIGISSVFVQDGKHRRLLLARPGGLAVYSNAASANPPVSPPGT